MNQNIQNWDQFIMKLGKEKEVPLPTEQLKDIVKMKGLPQMDFSQIQHHFKNGFQLTRNPKRLKWHIEDKYLFIWTISKYLDLNSLQFLQLEENNSFHDLSLILGVKTELLKEKWRSLSKYKLSKNPWTTEEDELIVDLKKKFPENKWTQLTHEFNTILKQTRYEKQIRERWNTVINPEILHESFSEEDGVLLFKLANKYNKSWSKISSSLKGRTQNAVKNYYNSTIDKLSKKIELYGLSEELLVYSIIQLQTLDPQKLSYQIDQTRKQVKIEENQSSALNYIHQVIIQPNYYQQIQQSFYLCYSTYPGILFMQQ